MVNVVTIIVFAAAFVACLTLILDLYLIFYLIYKRYPKYYVAIGSPSPYGYPKNQLVAQKLMMVWALRGIPAGFPKDKQLRKLLLFAKNILFPTFVFGAGILLLILLLLHPSI